MIKYNLQNINDWNFGDDNIIKVYYDNAVCYYKVISSGGTTAQTPCFAVVDDISQYQETEFEDVYDKTTEKWYKLNNLNQYEEYGVYGSGRSITYYKGKLTIDEGYEYEWNGSSWTNLGEVSGSSRVPQGYIELTYVETPKESSNKFIIPYEKQPYYKYSFEFTPINFWSSSYYAKLCEDEKDDSFFHIFKLDNGWGTQFYRFENWYQNYNFDTRSGRPMAGKYTVYEGVRSKMSFNLSGYTLGQGAIISVENEGYETFTGVSTTIVSSTYNPTYGVDDLYMFCGSENTYGKTPNMKFHNFKIETSGGTAVYDYLPCKRKSDDKVGIYDVVHNEFYSPSAFTLTAGDEVSHTEYPMYYSEKSDPLDNLTFNTMEEALAYECPWVGMTATIDGTAYMFCESNEWLTKYSYVEVTGDYLCENGNKYKKMQEYVRQADGTLTPTSNYVKGDLIEAESPDCGGYENQYFTLVAVNSGTFSFGRKDANNAIYYSLDNGSTWTELADSASTPTIQAGDKVLWKGTMTPIYNQGVGVFSATSTFDAEGNPLSLLFGDNFVGQTSLSGKDSALQNLFNTNTKIRNAKDLALVATTLSVQCYTNMFIRCNNLKTAPSLSAATTLQQGCYYNMFYSAASLTTSEAIFLPAPTLVQDCYRQMFYSCTNLSKITCLATSGINTNNSTRDWMRGTSSSSSNIFTKASSATWSRNNSGIPNGWTVQDYSE